MTLFDWIMVAGASAFSAWLILASERGRRARLGRELRERYIGRQKNQHERR